MGGRVVVATVVVVMFAYAATGGAMQIHARDPEWIAPPESSAKANPLANRLDVVAGGEKLFRQRCTTCHAADGRGTDRAPDLTAADVQAQSDGALFWKISGGNTRRGMPTFSFLPELQRWQLVMHLRSLGQQPHSGHPD